MGTSYQTILALGGLAQIRTVLTDVGTEAYVTRVGERRWAVVPREEEEGGYAEVDDLAQLITLRTREPAVAFDVFDSSVMRATLHVDGREAHCYLSDGGWVTEYWDDDDNEFLAGFDGTLHPVDAPPPPGPSGDDPAVFAPLGVGAVDPVALGAALRGEVPGDDEPRLFAECRHRAILDALRLDACPLTRPFRHAHLDHRPTPVHVRPGHG
ncbi:hypothetical protein KBX06_07905 [Micromonospora sp. C31]|uniref:hypothetical protein n=1 Tax=Micromonospora sp. C31 TaxID=2824876 RepID=UPI001B38AC17|nr:hypothetical protein [Micromonospora sp. C31]MBQ1073085.1 hypothetical protein [Micromonospora sp. C31]